MALKFSENDLVSRDIDWFFKQRMSDAIRFVHCASFGGYVPPVINQHEYLLSCQIEVSESSFIFEEEDIFIHEDNIKKMLGEHLEYSNMTREEEVKAYARSFVYMARKGFWSYDKFHNSHEKPSLKDNKYVLIASPKNDSRILEFKNFMCLDTMEVNLIDNL
ncbi:MAG: hypothetical protein NC453_26180 [Muribaculum sp.]|nr:hypothetical protein [Muribaculum sp.]